MYGSMLVFLEVDTAPVAEKRTGDFRLVKANQGGSWTGAGLFYTRPQQLQRPSGQNERGGTGELEKQKITHPLKSMLAFSIEVSNPYGDDSALLPSPMEKTGCSVTITP